MISQLLTVEEYQIIPDPPGGRYELYHGEAVFVPWPFTEHKSLRRKLRKLIEPLAEPLGFIVDTDYPYRPLPENEMWGANIACVLASRDRQSDWLEGSPELVIEVRSPSNSKAELHDKAMTTLAGAGAVEFWVADSRTRTVTVYRVSSGMRIYQGDASVPLPIASASISLKQLFAEIIAA